MHMYSRTKHCLQFTWRSIFIHFLFIFFLCELKEFSFVCSFIWRRLQSLCIFYLIFLFTQTDKYIFHSHVNYSLPDYRRWNMQLKSKKIKKNVYVLQWQWDSGIAYSALHLRRSVNRIETVESVCLSWHEIKNEESVRMTACHCSLYILYVLRT